MGSHIVFDPSTNTFLREVSEETVRIDVLFHVTEATRSQQPTLYSKSLSCGSSPLGIIPEGTSFMSNSLPSTVTCSFGKAYNPTSSKQILRAVFDDNVECVQDGKSGRADEDRCHQQPLSPNAMPNPLGIVPEGVPISFNGIQNDSILQETVVSNIIEGYNPTSTKGILKAVKVNDKVELSPDGESDRADGTLFRRRIYDYFIQGNPVTQVSSFESLGNYSNHYIRWYQDVPDGAAAEHLYVDSRKNSATREVFYWVVKDADNRNSNGYPYCYLLAPVDGIPEHGNPNPDYYMAFVNEKATITPNKLYADMFLIQKS